MHRRKLKGFIGLIVFSEVFLQVDGLANNDSNGEPQPGNPSNIVGRIEQTEAPDAELPLPLSQLKAETPKLDNQIAPTLKGYVTDSDEISGYPSTMDGYWGGQLTITAQEQSQIRWKHLAPWVRSFSISSKMVIRPNSSRHQSFCNR